MNTVKPNPYPVLRRNLLAAALAVALPLGMAAAAGTLPETPRSNAPAHATAMSLSAHSRVGTRNHSIDLTGSTGSELQPQQTTQTAAVIPVTSCADDGSGGTTLREAITGAADGDTIDLTNLTCSTITLISGHIPITDTGLTIQGPGAHQLTIDGNANSNILRTTVAGSQTLTIQGLTLTNGEARLGGCVYVYGALTLKNTTVTGCAVTGNYVYGGGVDVTGLPGDLTIDSSTITSNTADGDYSAQGGGVYALGDLTVKNGSVISGNHALAHGPAAGFSAAVGGGAISQGAAVVTDSVISGNIAHAIRAQAYGGGLAVGAAFASHAGTVPAVTIVSSTITGNAAWSGESWSYGGGVQAGVAGHAAYWPATTVPLSISYSTIAGNEVRSGCDGCVLLGGGAAAFGAVDVDHSTVSGNRVIAALGSSASAYGGGLVSRSAGASGTITIAESTISGNSADGRAGSAGGRGLGGGIAALLSPVSIDNSTVVFNQAGTNGGGVMIGDDKVALSVVRSSIIADNQAPLSANVAAFGVGYNGPAPVLGGSHNLIIDAGTRIAVPADTLNVEPRLLPLAMNGGATKTHALRPASPAINAGSNPDGDACDQRGNPYGRSAGGGVDIGAFEWQAVPTGPLQGPGFIFANGFDAGGPCS